MIDTNECVFPTKIPEDSILGINYSGMHDTAIALVSPDGMPIFALSLERVSRVKQDGRYPASLLEKMPWSRIAKVVISAAREYTQPEDLTSKFHPNPLEEPLVYDCSHGPQFLQALDSIPVEKVFVPHHLCHASSAFWLSGLADSTCLVYDGGMSNEEWFGGVYNATKKRGIIPVDMFSGHHYANVARVYTAITAILGFTPLRHEGKITGLAAYGSDSSDCKKIINEWFCRPEMLDGIVGWVNMYSGDLTPCLQVNPLVIQRFKDRLKKYSREDIAEAVQCIAEEHIIKILKKIKNKCGSNNLCLSGGLFANVKINQKASEIGFDHVFVSPPMSDDGTALGAALQVASENPTFIPRALKSINLGPCYSKLSVNKFISVNKVKSTVPKNLAGEVAQLLAKGSIIAVFQGAMEFGPRALGNRTILANADDSSINRLLNNRLGRTEFMPFAPVCQEEDASRLFQDMDCVKFSAKFMTVTRNCSKEMKNLCPAVVHCDGTARPQLVSSQSNPFIYEILTKYKYISEKPALVNTSFNVHEEPIICSPKDALKGFFESGLDVLIIEDHLIKLVENRCLESQYLRKKLWTKEVKLHENATMILDTNLQLNQLQTLLTDSNVKAEQAEAKAEQAEVKAEQAEVKAEQAEVKAEQAEVKAEQAEVKAEQAEVKAEQAEVKAEQAEVKAEQAEVKAEQAEVKAEQAEVKAEQAEVKAERFYTELNQVYHSHSWRITAPIRRMIVCLRKLSPGMLKGYLKLFLQHAALYLNRRPRLKKMVLVILNRFPYFKSHPRLVANNSHNASLSHPVVESIREAELSPHAREIYAHLKAAIEEKQKRDN